jgi:Tol biopolymer transport system component/predicted Ser/Thr protein kinase
MSPQQSIAHYRVTSKLGEGGMGEVWRATDTKLGRDVAIKVLPAALANDSAYMARFEREAQMLAALNHPNIAAVYGVEQGALIMELVEGLTLAERIAQAPIPIEEALPIARQIAEALEAAHERGIIHRDFKPANIKITPAGAVKLLDFGLAKSAGEFAAVSGSATISPTLSLAMTQAGMILGTAAYMAPEQARGKPVDKRADIWAFGVVLYEMLTGRQLFGGGETITDTLASVVKDAPDFDKLPASTPPHIRRLIERCLRKDAAKRLRDIGEARIAIDEPADSAAAPVAAPPRRRWLPWAVAGIVAIAGGAGWWRAARPAELRPLIRFDAELAAMEMGPVNNGSRFAISPDGARIALALHEKDGKVRLYTRALHQAQLAPLAGTEGAASPFFSPDGQWLGFWADSKLKKISVDGGAAVTLADVPGLRGASWGDDGTIVFSAAISSPLWRVSSSGGAPEALTKFSGTERTHRWPEVLPGSGAVLFTSHVGAVNYDDANVEVVALKTGRRKLLVHGGFSPHYVRLPNGDGRLLYVHQGTLFAVPFDAAALETCGAFAPVLEGVQSSGSAGSSLALSATGALLYMPGQGLSTFGQLTLIESSGAKRLMNAGASGYLTPRFSPDGGRLAFTRASGSGFDLWVSDLDRDTASRLTFLPGTNINPVWTPDGRYIVFLSSGHPAAGLYWIRADGGGEPRRLTDGNAAEVAQSFSPDGKRLAIYQRGARGDFDLFTVAVGGEPDRPTLGKPELFLGNPADEVYPSFSPDGKWLAYMSAESGTPEVYVRPFPGPGGRWQVSSAGGSYPIWGRNGRELLYRAADERINAVDYTVRGDSFNHAKPRVWTPVPVPSFGTRFAWDLAPDGKRIVAVLMESDERPSETRVTVLLNFTDDLQRKMAGGK